MPLYIFECAVGHRFEKIFSINECPKEIDCEINIDIGENSTTKVAMLCHLPATKQWALPAKMELGKPTRIFRNVNDPTDALVATGQNAAVPDGYVEEELRNPMERTKFEKERQQILDIKNEQITYSVQQRNDLTTKARHAEIEANMSSVPDDGTRAFLRDAMNMTRNRKEKVKKSSVRLDINHIDSSNLTPS